jgi:hypothetical protein
VFLERLRAPSSLRRPIAFELMPRQLDRERPKPAFGKLTSTGHALDEARAKERDAIIASIVASADGDLDRLAELAVAWVLANPQRSRSGHATTSAEWSRAGR